MCKYNYWIFPVFLPNVGCPHRCSFCDQKAVTGEEGHLPEIDQIEALFRKVRFSRSSAENDALIRQIAFYGGNFSGLNRQTQKRYLDWAAEKVARGQIQSLRFSTRPDALENDEIAFLKGYPIQTVEVGVQSLDDVVLKAVQRGHTAEACKRAVAKVVSSGWDAGVQLMPGLPGETLEGFLKGVETVSRWGIKYARLYPAIVLMETALADAYVTGAYTPLRLDAAVEWCARACEILENAGVTVIRIGLPASDRLKSSVIAGPYHPAFGFLVQSFRFHQSLRRKILSLPNGGRQLIIYLSPKSLSLLMGDRRQAWERLKADWPEKEISYCLESAFGTGEVDVTLGSALLDRA